MEPREGDDFWERDPSSEGGSLPGGYGPGESGTPPPGTPRPEESGKPPYQPGRKTDYASLGLKTATIITIGLVGAYIVNRVFDFADNVVDTVGDLADTVITDPLQIPSGIERIYEDSRKSFSKDSLAPKPNAPNAISNRLRSTPEFTYQGEANEIVRFKDQTGHDLCGIINYFQNDNGKIAQLQTWTPSDKGCEGPIFKNLLDWEDVSSGGELDGKVEYVWERFKEKSWGKIEFPRKEAPTYNANFFPDDNDIQKAYEHNVTKVMEVQFANPGTTPKPIQDYKAKVLTR